MDSRATLSPCNLRKGNLEMLSKIQARRGSTCVPTSCLAFLKVKRSILASCESFKT